MKETWYLGRPTPSYPSYSVIYVFHHEVGCPHIIQWTIDSLQGARDALQKLSHDHRVTEVVVMNTQTFTVVSSYTHPSVQKTILNHQL